MSKIEEIKVGTKIQYQGLSGQVVAVGAKDSEGIFGVEIIFMDGSGGYFMNVEL